MTEPSSTPGNLGSTVRAVEDDLADSFENETMPNVLFSLGPGVPVCKGDWVLVYGHVQSLPLSNEVEISFQSHNEDWTGLITTDHVHSRVGAPKGWPTCPHLFQPTGWGLVRCNKDQGHSGDHRAEIDGQPGHWTDQDTVGYMEEKS